MKISFVLEELTIVPMTKIITNIIFVASFLWTNNIIYIITFIFYILKVQFAPTTKTNKIINSWLVYCAPSKQIKIYNLSVLLDTSYNKKLMFHSNQNVVYITLYIISLNTEMTCTPD